MRVDAERNRKRVIVAATAVISREGIDASVESIAREAGVGVGTVYRRFPTKAELVRAILLDRSEEATARLERATDHGDPWESLTAGLDSLGEQLAAERGLFDAVVRDAEAAAPVDEVRARLLAALKPLHHRAAEAGVLRADVSPTDLLALIAMATRPPTRRLGPGLWRRWLAIVLDGLRAPGAAALPGSSPPERLPADPPPEAGPREPPPA